MKGGTRPSTLLLVFMVTIPLLVALAGVCSVVLIRSGYGVLTALVLPSAGLSVAVVVLGVVVGRAASRRAAEEKKGRNRG